VGIWDFCREHILISEPIDISLGELSGPYPAGVGSKAVNRNNANIWELTEELMS
jgi:hypothetical protein